MPAHAAEKTICRAVRSILAQDHDAFEVLIVADDDADYAHILSDAGLKDPRIRFHHTGAKGSGSPPARNIGLDHANHRYAAILDADDAFLPGKLSASAAHLQDAALISTGLQVRSVAGDDLREVGTGVSGWLAARHYKFVNLSMDSMLVHDRRAADPRFDPGLPCLTDLDFALKIFASVPRALHLGAPLHTYYKTPGSISNRPGSSAAMASVKKLILERLRTGYYPLADPEGISGIADFLTQSLAAETVWPDAFGAQPGLLFEDHLEARLVRPPGPLMTPLTPSVK